MSTLTEALEHLEWALYYADPPHPAAKDRLNEAQQFLDKHKNASKFPKDLRQIQRELPNEGQ